MVLLLTALALTIFYALLWSPWWYPLSDSSLYLNMARGLMQGKGLASLRQIHRDVRPLTPLLLFAIMKLGGGIGAMHTVMIGLMLLSHGLMFLTLRRWFNERVALLATIATATSWWVYANAFTIMTEPLFLVMFWAGMLSLSYVPRAMRRAQWMLVIAGALLLAGAWGNRIAAILLLPGTVFGLWMSNRHISWKTRSGWVAVFGIVFSVLIWDWRRPMPGIESAGASAGGVTLLDAGDEAKSTVPEAYKMNYLVGVSSPLVQLPVSAGRWVIEGLAAVTEAPFESNSTAILIMAGIFAFTIFLLTCAGWFRLLRGGHWYALGMAAYFLPYWFLWGTRIKPRYMMPIAPILFIQLWCGTAMLLAKVGGGKALDFAARFRRFAAPVGTTLLAGALLLNLVPYGIDFYIRHQTKLNFYDIARRGAFAELVDIGAYLQKNAPPDAPVWVNWTPNRRIVAFLSNHEVRSIPTAKRHGTADLPVHDPGDTRALSAYLKQVPGDWAIVYYNQYGWPTYHLPLATEGRGASPRWWQLWHRDSRGKFYPVDTPPRRDRVRSIPGLGR